MKPAPFDYHAPGSLAEALELLSRYGDDAKVLAGGQSLVPAMNFRLAQPSVLVDCNRLGELAYIRPSAEGLGIGAMTRQRAVEKSAEVRGQAPLVAQTMPWIAHPQIRNRGTFGGSLAHADPAAELPAVMLALDARLKTASTRGERSHQAGEFFQGLFETALEPDELLCEVVVPAPQPGGGFAFAEMSRRHGDFALVGVAVALRLVGDTLADVRIGLLSVGETAVLATGAAEMLEGKVPGMRSFMKRPSTWPIAKSSLPATSTPRRTIVDTSLEC